MHLWIRRCELFCSFYAIIRHLQNLGIVIVSTNKHELFPELVIINDVRGYKWYACEAPIHGL